jgi:hypothetical protein
MGTQETKSKKNLHSANRFQIFSGEYKIRAIGNNELTSMHDGFNSFIHSFMPEYKSYTIANGRRLISAGQDDTCAVELDEKSFKMKQCERLVACATNYNYYDLLVYMFTDDIDLDSGKVDDDIKLFDGNDISTKLNNILGLSTALKTKIENGGLSDIDILEDGICDDLLQEFHRFDESIGSVGKWQGGTVTSVCRGWGTSKFLSLESIFNILDANNKGEKNISEKAVDIVVNVFQEFVECVVSE